MCYCTQQYGTLIDGVTKTVSVSFPLAKALAVLEALKLTKDMEAALLVVDYDSMVLLQSILDNQSCTWMISATIKAILPINTNFENVSFSKISRQANCVAYCLAKLVIKNLVPCN